MQIFQILESLHLLQFSLSSPKHPWLCLFHDATSLLLFLPIEGSSLIRRSRLLIGTRNRIRCPLWLIWWQMEQRKPTLFACRSTKVFSSARLYKAECALPRSQSNIYSREIDKIKTLHSIPESLFFLWQTLLSKIGWETMVFNVPSNCEARYHTISQRFNCANCFGFKLYWRSSIMRMSNQHTSIFFLTNNPLGSWKAHLNCWLYVA